MAKRAPVTRNQIARAVGNDAEMIRALEGLFGSVGSYVVSSLSVSGSADENAQVVLANASSGNVTVTLPTAVGNGGKYFFVKKVDSTGNKVIVSGAPSIDGDATLELLLQYECVQLVSDGSNWYVV